MRNFIEGTEYPSHSPSDVPTGCSISWLRGAGGVLGWFRGRRRCDGGVERVLRGFAPRSTASPPTFPHRPAVGSGSGPQRVRVLPEARVVHLPPPTRALPCALGAGRPVTLRRSHWTSEAVIRPAEDEKRRREACSRPCKASAPRPRRYHNPVGLVGRFGDNKRVFRGHPCDRSDECVPLHLQAPILVPEDIDQRRGTRPSQKPQLPRLDMLSAVSDPSCCDEMSRVSWPRRPTHGLEEPVS